MSLRDIELAYNRIRGFINQTPVLTSNTLEKLANAKTGGTANYKFYFKCENLQKTGAFKARGACNAALLAKGNNVHGVVTHSSGNHGQALAWAASKEVADLDCTIVVPRATPKVKCDAIRGYGADLQFCENSPTSRKDTCQKISDSTGKVIIHPYDNDDIIAGQGTMIWEMVNVQNCSDLDAIVTTVSGGGMSAGICIAAKQLNPKIKVILVTPQGKMLEECLSTGERLWPNPPQFLDTIAEGIKTQQVGMKTFPILCKYAEKNVIEVTDAEMIEGMKFAAERMKMIIEASAGAVIAALLCHADQIHTQWPDAKNIGVILCGGNTDVDKLPWTV